MPEPDADESLVPAPPQLPAPHDAWVPVASPVDSVVVVVSVVVVSLPDDAVSPVDSDACELPPPHALRVSFGHSTTPSSSSPPPALWS